jgi:hypothetical protein
VSQCHNESLTASYDTLSLQDGGAMGIRDAWIEKRAAAMNGGPRNFSQMHFARHGVITEEMEYARASAQ